jgi:hypothetical protein
VLIIEAYIQIFRALSRGKYGSSGRRAVWASGLFVDLGWAFCCEQCKILYQSRIVFLCLKEEGKSDINNSIEL